VLLSLGLAAGQFLDLLFVGAAGGSPLGLRGGLLAGGALYLFAFCLVFDLGGVGHEFLFRCSRDVSGGLEQPAGKYAFLW
jgi:hypothetical protein